MKISKARERLRWCDSYSRIPTLIELAPLLKPTHWFRLLGKEWEGCDNIGLYHAKLLPLLNEKKAVREMMTKKEWRAFRQLPTVIPVFRGAYFSNAKGLSWSTSNEVAMKFPFYYRYRQKGIPLLISATVRKENVIAVKLGRNELEIIALQPEIKSISQITAEIGQDGEVTRYAIHLIALKSKE